MKFSTCFIAAAIAVSSSTALAVPLLHTSDFINDSARAGFNGFEALPDVGWADLYATTYSEGGIKIDLVGDNRAWTYNWLRQGFEGSRFWYSNPVYGYNSITRTDGQAFDSVGMLVGSGYGGYCRDRECDDVAPYLYLGYRTLSHGVVVSSGLLPNHNPNAHYLGFSGGGFDEVQVWDYNPGGWPGHSAIMLDAIEMTASTKVPEPATPALLFAGMGLLALGARRRQRASRNAG